MITGYLDQPYTSIIEGYLDQPYELTTPLRGHLDQPYTSQVTGYLNQPYRNSSFITGYLNQFYSEATPLTHFLDAPYDSSRIIQQYLDAPYDLANGITGYLDAGYNFAGITLTQYLDAPYDLLPIGILTGYIDQPYSLLDNTTTIVPVEAEVLIAGNVIEFSKLNIKYSKNTVYRECDITLCDEKTYNSIADFDSVSVTLLGTLFTFFIESKKIQEQHGAQQFTLDCLSNTALLDAPYSNDVVFPDEGLIGTASDIAASLAGAVPINFNIVEWPLLSGTFMPDDLSPVAALKELASTVGAIVQSTATSEFNLEYMYPESPYKWTVPEYIIVSEERLFSMTIDLVPKDGTNMLLISDTAATQFSVSLSQEVKSSTEIDVRAVVSPWQDSLNIEHSGGPWVLPYHNGITAEEIDKEIVEIINGIGKAQNPILSVVSSRWLWVNLGEVEVTDDGSITTELLGESLLELTYNTRFHSYTFVDPKAEEVQIIAKDNENVS